MEMLVRECTFLSGMVVQTFNPSNAGGRGRHISKIEANLVCIASFMAQKKKTGKKNKKEYTLFKPLLYKVLPDSFRKVAGFTALQRAFTILNDLFTYLLFKMKANVSALLCQWLCIQLRNSRLSLTQ